MINHEYHLLQDHSIAPEDLLVETDTALRQHNQEYMRDPVGYFEEIDNAKRFCSVDNRPYLHFKGVEDSETDVIIAALPIANRLHPANSGEELGVYAAGGETKLPKGMRPNSTNQAIEHRLAYTAIAGLPEAKDEQGRSPSLVVVSSPAADFHQPRLNKDQRKQMKQGDLEPYANALADIAEEVGAGRLHITGFSFGAAVAARAARIRRNFDVKSLTIGEPTTHLKRSTLRIMGDYTVLDAFNKSSGNKHLEKVPNTDWLQHGPQALRDLDRNGNGGWFDNLYANGNIRTNLQIARALGKPTLLEELGQSRDLPLTLLRASDSLMTRSMDDWLPNLTKEYMDDDPLGLQVITDNLQLLKVRPIGAVAAKHIVGKIPALYADYVARGIKHGYSYAKR